MKICDLFCMGATSRKLSSTGLVEVEVKVVFFTAALYQLIKSLTIHLLKLQLLRSAVQFYSVTPNVNLNNMCIIYSVTLISWFHISKTKACR